MYEAVNNKYMIANIRQMPLPTNEPEHFEDWKPFMGYTDIDGCVVITPLPPLTSNQFIIVAIQSGTNGVDSQHIL